MTTRYTRSSKLPEDKPEDRRSHFAQSLTQVDPSRPTLNSVRSGCEKLPPCFTCANHKNTVTLNPQYSIRTVHGTGSLSPLNYNCLILHRRYTPININIYDPEPVQRIYRMPELVIIPAQGMIGCDCTVIMHYIIGLTSMVALDKVRRQGYGPRCCRCKNDHLTCNITGAATFHW